MAQHNGTASATVDSAFGRLVEELTTRLQAGEPVDWSIVERDHPGHANELEAIRPAMEMLGNLSQAGNSAVSGVAPTASDDDTLSGMLGDFRLIREVGRGGMGVVYEAEQISLDRRVALKVLPYAGAFDAKQLQRFKNEAKAAASLKHEHIVQVHAIGCERGVHFYAMEFIEGQTLAQLIAWRAGSRERPEDVSTPVTAPYIGAPELEAPKLGALTQPRSPDTAPVAALSTQLTSARGREFYRNAAELIADAADALEHAHSLGIVHRDIKPGNLLLDNAGKVYVSDFGLARLGADAGLTMSGDLLGTLRYMAPEQAMARHGLADHRVDVYGLGCTLYELLTGKPALRGEDKAEILRQIAFEEPIAPRKLDKHIPAELETITLKCLAKNPSERYATAGELATDLRRFMEDKLIKARRPTARQRLSRWARRHPGWTAALGLAVGLLLAGAWAWHRETAYAETAARTVAAESDELRDADRLLEALAVARRAAGLLPRIGGDADLRRAIDERVADLQLLNALEQVLLDSEVETSPRVGRQRLATLYQQAFQDHGVDVVSTDELTIVNGLRRPAIAAPVAAALGRWEAAAADPAIEQRLGRLSEALDPDERKLISRLRRAEAAKDVEALKRLAVDAEADLPSPATLPRFAKALNDVSCFPEAERLMRAGQQRYPGHYAVNHQLAATLWKGGPTKAAEAVRFYTAAVAIRPFSPSAWACLGEGLRNAQRYEEANAACRRAIALKPDFAVGYNNLGAVLAKLGRHVEAEAEYRRAIALEPDYVDAHFNLGLSLDKQGRFAEPDAETALRRAIQLKPDWEPPHGVLGNVLFRQGRLAEALTAKRAANALVPRSEKHHDAGLILKMLDRHQEAEAEFRSAIKLKPDCARSHVNLGNLLVSRGCFSEAAEKLRLGHEIGRKEKDWPDSIERKVREAERMAALAPRLPSLMAGESRPADATEQLTLAQICERYKKRYVAAAGFYAAALAAEPKLADELNSDRYSAANSAALAANGQGEDAATLDDTGRARLRRQALDCLTAELAAWAKLAGNAADRPKIRQAMQHWQRDPDFAGVRGDAALAKLPEAERAAWQKLWADVADLLKRTETPKAAEKAGDQP